MTPVAKPEQVGSRKQHPLLGSWVNGDEYATNVEYIISGGDSAFQVRAVDRYDGEEGEVRDIAYDKKTLTLSFTVYWGSTGRLVRVRMAAISQNRVSYTYSFTENQMWFRKGTEPVAAPNCGPSPQEPISQARKGRNR